jgi:apolipoprotein D and lipocalin family protein
VSPIECLERCGRSNPGRGAAFCLALALATLLPATAGSEAAAQDERPVTPVNRVDLVRYSGLWHEIARIPNRFQKQCARGTTAEYALQDDGLISVTNRCMKEDGSLDEAKGVAKITDTVSNARLKVSFVSFLGWRPFWGDYWVIGLDGDYEWAVVGTPDRKYGWVLARATTLDGATMAEILAILERNGYDWNDFEMNLP